MGLRLLKKYNTDVRRKAEKISKDGSCNKTASKELVVKAFLKTSCGRQRGMSMGSFAVIVKEAREIRRGLGVACYAARLTTRRLR